MAQALGSVGYISKLHRSAVGPFRDTDAISLDLLEKSVHNAPASGVVSLWLTPLHAALDDIPVLALEQRASEHTSPWSTRVTLADPPDTPLLFRS